MSNRKYLNWLLLLALFITLALTACGGTEDIEEAVQEAAEEIEEAAPIVKEVEEVTETTEEEVAEEAVAEESVDVGYDTDVYGNIDEVDLSGAHVVFWTRYDSGSRKEAMDVACADFNATNEYGITVECLGIGGYGDLYDAMIAGLTTGDVPGLVVAYQNNSATYMVADGLVAVDPYLNHPEYGLSEADRADYVQAFIDADRLPQFGNQAYSFPAVGRSMEVLYYNKDWLTELGYDAPPQTPEEFTEMACAAAEQPFSKNESGFSTGLEVSTDPSAFAALIFARGGEIFQDGAFTYNTEEAITAATQMQELFDQGCVTEIAEAWGDQTDFGNGKTLFTSSSSSNVPWYVGAVNDGEVGGFEWSVAPIPYTGAEPAQNLYGASVSIVKTDPQTQLAGWLFLKHLSSPEKQALWMEQSNYFPVRHSATEHLDDYIAENPAFGAAFELIQYGTVEAFVAGYDNVRDAVEQAYIDIIFNGVDAASTLEALTGTANAIMAESAPDSVPRLPAVEEPAVEPAAPEYDEALYGVIEEVDLDGAQVVFWTRYDSGGRQEAMDTICADFNATNEYGITVECLGIGGYGDLYDAMIAGLTTGDVPGLVVAYQDDSATYMVADGLVNVDPYLTHPVYGLSEADMADFVQEFIDADRLVQFDYQAYSFPAVGRSMEVLYYNKDWLTELGYDAPPQTPEEFAEMACAAAAQPFSKNESGFSTGLEVSVDASAFAALVFARGGQIFQDGAFTYNSDEAIAAATQMQDLYAQGCVTEIAEKYGDETDFGNGETLFISSSTSNIPFFDFAVDDGEVGGFEWSVAPIPYTGDEPVQNLYGASVSLVKTDPQTQLAGWLFLKHLSSPENQALWMEQSNYFPVRNSATDNLDDYIAENPAFGAAFELIQYGTVEAFVAGYAIVHDAAGQAFSDIVFNGADVVSTLEALDVTANEIMEESAPE